MLNFRGVVVGGFNRPFLKNMSQLGLFPQVKLKNTKHLKPPPRLKSSNSQCQ